MKGRTDQLQSLCVGAKDSLESRLVVRCKLLGNHEHVERRRNVQHAPVHQPQQRRFTHAIWADKTIAPTVPDAERCHILTNVRWRPRLASLNELNLNGCGLTELHESIGLCTGRSLIVCMRVLGKCVRLAFHVNRPVCHTLAKTYIICIIYDMVQT